MKKLIITILLVAVGAFAWLLIEPLLGDDVVNEELKVSNRNLEIDSSYKTKEVPTNQLEIIGNDKDYLPTEEEIEPDPLPNKPEPDVPAEETEVNNNPEPIVETIPKVLSGNFVDADPSHRASGKVLVQESDLSLVDLNSTNVPDGFVYLATDKNATDFVSLGKLKGNVGNQNYLIPEGTDLDKYDTVLIWCKAFSLLVGSAELN